MLPNQDALRRSKAEQALSLAEQLRQVATPPKEETASTPPKPLPKRLNPTLRMDLQAK